MGADGQCATDVIQKDSERCVAGVDAASQINLVTGYGIDRAGGISL